MPGGAVDAPAGAPLPPTTDLMTSLPAPVLRLLIVFASPIAALRAVLEVLLWKPERRVQSWMLLLVWWFTCLSGGYIFAWLAPPILFAPLLPLNRLGLGERKVAVQTSPARPATGETVLATLGDVHRIVALLPPSPLPPLSATYERFRALGPRRLVRGLVVLWGIWIALDHALGTSVLVALVGTVLLLAPSPPLAQVVHYAGKSLSVRRTVALLFLLIFGSPDRDYRLGSPLGWLKSKWASSRRPSVVLASSPIKVADEPAPADRAGNPIYFRFELHENQRWWMGLDWTSALLPQERPSWCDSHLLPVAPPQAFALPLPSSIDLPAGSKEPGLVRRTATWRWLDDDWSTVKKVKGASPPDPSPAPVAAPPSRPTSGLFSASPTDGTRAPSIAETAFAKGLGKLKSVPLPGAAPQSPAQPRASLDAMRKRTGSESTDASHEDMASPAVGAGGPEGSIPESDNETDADGWVYGDNKWENMTARGGLGKFTRRRRWTRRAVCTESVHRISSESAVVPVPEDAGSGAATPLARRKSSGTASAGGTFPRAPTSPAPKAAVAAPSVASDRSETHREPHSGPVVAPAPAPSTLIPSSSKTGQADRDQQLKLRLKKAMGNMGA